MHGELIDLSDRVVENHCGSCSPGFYLSATKCIACGKGRYQPQSQNTGNKRSCAPCTQGKYQNSTGMPYCKAWRNCKPGFGRLDSKDDNTIYDIRCTPCAKAGSKKASCLSLLPKKPPPRSPVHCSMCMIINVMLSLVQHCHLSYVVVHAKPGIVAVPA